MDGAVIIVETTIPSLGVIGMVRESSQAEMQMMRSSLPINKSAPLHLGRVIILIVYLNSILS